MDKLLQWSIAQQSGDKEAMAKVGQPDPKMLQQLFGGPDEPALMKQAIIVATNPESEAESKEVALENFEMLVENLDNANNIENLKLWPSIVELLLSDSLNIQVLAAGIIGTAVQNNPPSQEAFVKQQNGIAKLIELATNSPTELALKCTFALACVLRNCSDAFEQFEKHDGWKVLKGGASDTKTVLRQLSVASAILSTGLTEDKTKHFQQDGLVAKLTSTLTPETDIGVIDKTLHLIASLHRLDYKFSASVRADLAKHLQAIELLKNELSHDDYVAATEVTKA